MANATILAIGSELLEGSIIDTNSAFLGDLLTRHGVTVQSVRLVPDDMESIVNSFRDALDESDIVLTTGGLGPTFDDITAEALATATEQPFVLFTDVLKSIRDRLASRGVEMKESHTRQAFLPESAKLFTNERGTAPGICVGYGNSVAICMPGIPYEMTLMFEKYVMPFLIHRFSLSETHRIDLRFAAVPESNVDDAIKAIGIPHGVTCIINVAKGECLVKLRSASSSLMTPLADGLKASLSAHFVGEGNETLAHTAVRMLKERNMTLSVAESCTGGYLGKEITSISGSSDVFTGGVLSYSDDVKRNLLHVPADVIATHGAVSRECAEAMATGVKNLLGTDCAIAITGIAGPNGGTEEKPVGTVHIAVATPKGMHHYVRQFPGDREGVREWSVKTALRNLQQALREI